MEPSPPRACRPAARARSRYTQTAARMPHLMTFSSLLSPYINGPRRPGFGQRIPSGNAVGRCRKGIALSGWLSGVSLGVAPAAGMELKCPDIDGPADDARE